MIVVINKPVGAYYAAEVAGPVFREVADKVYSSDLDMNQSIPPATLVGNTLPPKVKTGNHKAIEHVYGKLGIKPLYASNNVAGSSVDTTSGLAYEEVKYKKGSVPDVLGMGLSDALYILGNAGYRVNAHGSGVVARQSVSAGAMVPVGSKILIELE
jgi:cell division protein FtsI (penicillin-binding protein 3)